MFRRHLVAAGAAARWPRTGHQVLGQQPNHASAVAAIVTPALLQSRCLSTSRGGFMSHPTAPLLGSAAKRIDNSGTMSPSAGAPTDTDTANDGIPVDKYLDKVKLAGLDYGLGNVQAGRFDLDAELNITVVDTEYRKELRKKLTEILLRPAASKSEVTFRGIGGGGKSHTLLLLVKELRELGHCVVYVPDGQGVVSGGLDHIVDRLIDAVKHFDKREAKEETPLPAMEDQVQTIIKGPTPLTSPPTLSTVLHAFAVIRQRCRTNGRKLLFLLDQDNRIMRLEQPRRNQVNALIDECGYKVDGQLWCASANNEWKERDIQNVVTMEPRGAPPELCDLLVPADSCLREAVSEKLRKEVVEATSLVPLQLRKIAEIERAGPSTVYGEVIVKYTEVLREEIANRLLEKEQDVKKNWIDKIWVDTVLKMREQSVIGVNPNNYDKVSIFAANEYPHQLRFVCPAMQKAWHLAANNYLQGHPPLPTETLAYGRWFETQVLKQLRAGRNIFCPDGKIKPKIVCHDFDFADEWQTRLKKLYDAVYPEDDKEGEPPRLDVLIPTNPGEPFVDFVCVYSPPPMYSRHQEPRTILFCNAMGKVHKDSGKELSSQFIEESPLAICDKVGMKHCWYVWVSADAPPAAQESSLVLDEIDVPFIRSERHDKSHRGFSAVCFKDNYGLFAFRSLYGRKKQPDVPKKQPDVREKQRDVRETQPDPLWQVLIHCPQYPTPVSPSYYVRVELRHEPVIINIADTLQKEGLEATVDGLRDAVKKKLEDALQGIGIHRLKVYPPSEQRGNVPYGTGSSVGGVSTELTPSSEETPYRVTIATEKKD